MNPPPKWNNLPPSFTDNPPDWATMSPEEIRAYTELSEGYLMDDAGYQNWYRVVKENGNTLQNVATLMYGSDCTNAHQSCPQHACVNENLIALFEFDLSGDPWKDNAGSYDLTSDTPPTLQGYGIVGDDMVLFDATNEYLNNTAVPLTTKENFTVALWVNGTTSPSDFAIIAGGHKWDVLYDPYNLRYRFTVGHSTGAVFVNSDSGGTLAFNATRLIVCRKDGDHISISIMWNAGNSFDCEIHSLGTGYVENNGVGIADLAYKGTGPALERMQGNVDELTLWQRCLSNSEVDWLYNGGSGRLLSTLFCGGGVVAGGSANVTSTQSVSIGGGVTIGGAAETTPFAMVGSGTMLFSGDVGAALSLPAVGQGTLTFDGTVTPVFTLGITGSGTLTFDGTATADVIAWRYRQHRMVFDNDYRNQQLITIADGKVDTNLADFPVLVSVICDDQQAHFTATGHEGLSFAGTTPIESSDYRITGSGGFNLGPAEADIPDTTGGFAFSGTTKTAYGFGRNDFAFELSDRTKLNHEVETYNAVTGELIAWVQLPNILAKSTNEFYCYYGADSTTTPTMPFGGFEDVYHCTTFDANDPATFDGKIYQSFYFDGNDSLQVNTDGLTATQDYTIEGWIKPTATWGNQVLFSRGGSDGTAYGWSLSLGFNGDGIWAAAQVDTGPTWSTINTYGTTPLTVGEWSYIVAVWTSGENLAVYLDGTLESKTTTTETTLVDYDGTNTIGKRDGFFLRGYADEVRLSGSARSAEWIKATFDTANNPDTFSTESMEQHAMHLWGTAPVIVTRNVVGSGTLNLSGSATTETTIFVFVGSGTLTLSGSAPIRKEHTGTGVITFAGSATTYIAGFRDTGSGGLSLSSSSVVVPTWSPVGTGGLTFSGSSNVEEQNTYTPTGDLRLKGSATTAYTPSYTATGSGALTIAGTTQPEWLEYGSMVLSGSAIVVGQLTLPTGGTLTFGGSANVEEQNIYTPTGGFKLEGSASTSNTPSYTATGAGTLTVSGTTQPDNWEFGTLTFGGSAIVVGHLTLPTSGILIFSGSANVEEQNLYIPTGGFTLQGSHIIGLGYTATGGMVFGGGSPPAINYEYVGGQCD